MRAGQIRLAFISSSSRLSREGEEKTVQPFPPTWALLFYYNWVISLKHCIWKCISSDVVLLNFKRSIFPPMYETYKRSLCTESWPFPLSPPAYITLDRSDGVQTTAPPSLPTQLEGLGSQLHDLHRWCTLYHSAATLHAAWKKRTRLRRLQYNTC